MANFFGNYLGKFALLATSVLWAGCSDADKNADKSPEQEHTKIEYPNESKKTVYDKSSVAIQEKQKVLDNVYELLNEPPKRDYRFDQTQFNANNVEIKISRAVLIDDSLCNNDVEKIANILRKKSKALFKTYDSFYKKDVHEEWNHLFLTLDIFINEKGSVKKIEFDKVDNKVHKGFEKKIIELLKRTHFKDVGKNIVSLSFDFHHPIKDITNFERLEGLLYGSPAVLMSRAKGAVSTPTKDELILSNGVIYDKASILRVIRQRIPGLRHIYNKHLNRNRAKACQKNNQDDVDPDFSGTIVFQLNIDVNGFVQKIDIQSSNTGNKNFDDEVKNAISRWIFRELKSSDVVTFPITFFKDVSEYKITTSYKKPFYPEIRM